MIINIGTSKHMLIVPWAEGDKAKKHCMGIVKPDIYVARKSTFKHNPWFSLSIPLEWINNKI